MEFLVFFLTLAITVHAFPQGDVNIYQVNSTLTDGTSSNGMSDDDIMKLLMSLEEPTTTAKPQTITTPKPVYSYENNSIADTGVDDSLGMRSVLDISPVRDETFTATNRNQAYTISNRASPPPPLASGGIRYVSLNDDHLYVENDTYIDSARPVFSFNPGDFVYPNSENLTPSTTVKPTTTTTKATTSSTRGPIFSFHFEDFVTTPVSPRATEPTKPEPNYRQKPEENTDEDEEDEDSTDNIEILPESPKWNESHPCNYPLLEHEIVVQKQGRRVSEIQCEYHMWNYKHKILEAERKRVECDAEMKKTNELVTGVIGGLEASQGEFPHMGAVGWRARDNSYTFMCGCSIISSRYAITVAHCSIIDDRHMDFNNLIANRPEIVRFGSVYIKSADDPNSKLLFVDVGIDGDLIILPKYTFLYKYNDIALIKLVSDVDIQANVRPACLWVGDLRNQILANITGWGQTTKIRGSQTSHLRYAEIDIIDRENCSKNLTGRIATREWWGLVDHQFCAGKPAGGVDSCQGDSGGPLQVQRPLPSSIDSGGIMYYIVGLTSFGSKCAWPYRPGVYVNVSDPHFLCWIEKTVWPDEPNPFCPQNLFEGYEPPKPAPSRSNG